MRRLTRLTSIAIALTLPVVALTCTPLAAAGALQQEPSVRQPVLQPETLDSLRSKITNLVSQPAYESAQWGIKVISLDTGRTLFEQKPNAYYNPASNAKLFTAALALTRLGPDFRIKTSLYSTAPPDSGVIKGDLIVYGRGDPTFAARLNDGDYYRALEPLAAVLASAGIKKIDGDLVGDESYFRGPPFGSGWEWDNLQWYYGAEVSALTVNDNSVDLFVKPGDRAGLPCRISTGPAVSNLTIINRTQTGAKGSECRISVYRPVGENTVYISGCIALGSDGFTGFVAVHNPANLFASLFREVLERRGIAVTGKTRTFDWKYREIVPLDPKKLTDLGSVDSLPIKDIVRETLKPSQNLYAQLLLLQAGANAV
ncbi:MAG TPA: D-alanyl-D-alanine carboxypeptidase/D-alanyl-D-alanine-endopeptidase, partial [Blastocatellia bacterium]|nr:D-alanyl-D-alanine carboxypeptidase/D-alanyl-D-alanine-endopeptidase [Blastocatellia bacterium]